MGVKVSMPLTAGLLWILQERLNKYRIAEAAKLKSVEEREEMRSSWRRKLGLRLKGKITLRDILTALNCKVR